MNDGNVYNGTYVSGKRQGHGKIYYSNGDIYVGYWKDDKIEGFGRYYYNNGHMYVIVGLIPSEPAATCNLSF